MITTPFLDYHNRITFASLSWKSSNVMYYISLFLPIAVLALQHSSGAEMAQAGVTVNHDRFSCSICLDLLKDPVTIPCGHNYCMDCIKTHWRTQQNVYDCPQCRQHFVSRPVLMKNTMLADLVEELKKTKIQTPATRPQDVTCDVCIDKKLKAVRSCLQCLASFCEQHLQPHHQSSAFAKHQLTPPSEKLQDNICPRHNEVRKMFCRSDQQCICYLCSVDEHKGHDTVTAKAERALRQQELEAKHQKVLQKIQDKEIDMKVLRQEEVVLNRSADKAAHQSDELFTHLIRLMEDRRGGVEKQIRAQQQTEIRRVQELQDKRDQELVELKKSQSELEALSQTLDDSLFLHNYLSLSEPQDSPETSSIQTHPLQYFRDMTAAVSALTNKLQYTLSEGLAKVSPDDLEPEPKPETREGFLKYSREITLDPNTAHTQLALSDGNKRATLVREHFTYPEHPDRFRDWRQVLSSESLTGRCYWEVEWTGNEGVYVAVAYRNIKRQGSSFECLFGYNDKSWALYCGKNTYGLWFNGISSPVSGPHSTRVGVYLDHTAGVLSFYSVSQTMTLLHRVQTTFTQPLHAGLWLYYPEGITAAFSKLK